MRRLLPSGISLVLVALTFVATSAFSSSALAADLLARATGAGPADAASLEVGARLPELWPGRQVNLEVLVTNRGGAPFRISAIDVQVADAAPDCTADNIAVPGFTDSAGTYVVPAGTTVVVPVPLTMLNLPTNQDGCKGVTFPMRYTVSTAPAP